MAGGQGSPQSWGVKFQEWLLEQEDVEDKHAQEENKQEEGALKYIDEVCDLKSSFVSAVETLVAAIVERRSDPEWARTEAREALESLEKKWSLDVSGEHGTRIRKFLMELQTVDGPYDLLSCVAIPLPLRLDSGFRNDAFIAAAHLEFLWDQRMQYEQEDVMVAMSEGKLSDLFRPDADPRRLFPHFDVNAPLPTTTRAWSMVLKFQEYLRLRGHKKEFRFAYTTNVQLFRPQDVFNQALLFKALSTVGSDSGAYATVVGNAMVTFSWNWVEGAFWLRRCIVVVSVCCLCVIGHAVRHSYMPSYWSRSMLLFVSILEAISLSVEMLGAYLIENSIYETIRDYLHGWNLFVVLLQVYSLYVTFWLYSSTYEEVGAGGYAGRSFLEVGKALNKTVPCDDEKCGVWLHDHPVYLVCLIWSKLIKLAVDILCFRGLGEHILPAYESIVSQASVRFIVYTFLQVISTFLAYYVLPINVDHGVLDTFLTMFRLDIMGDFDLGDMEGENQKLIGDIVPNGNDFELKGHVDNPDHPVLYYKGVTFLFVFCCIVINIVTMNVYIGLLSTLYNDNVARRRQLFLEFRSVYVWKLLASRYGWSKIFKCLGIYECFGICGTEDDRLNGGGVWIAYNVDAFTEELRDTGKAIDTVYQWVQKKIEDDKKNGAERSTSSCHKSLRNFW